MKSTTRRFHETSRCIFSICLGEQWTNPPIIFRIVVYQNVLITIWINPHNQSPRQVDQPSLWWDLRWCIVWPQGRYNPSRNGTFARSSIPLVVWGPSHCQAQTPHFHSPEGVWNWQNFQVEDEKIRESQIDGMAHQMNPNDTCPQIFRNANRRPWVSGVHDEWGCIINKIHGSKYLLDKNAEYLHFPESSRPQIGNPETFTNFILYLPWWLANNANHPYLLSLSTVPLDPVSHITSVLSLVELQDSASATTTSVDALQRSLQACESWCLCLWVSWCQWKTRASSLLSGTMAARYRKIKSKVTIDDLQGASLVDRNPIDFATFTERVASFCVRHPTHGERFKRCQCQMIFWPHASGLQMQADARCRCATCPLCIKKYIHIIWILQSL